MTDVIGELIERLIDREGGFVDNPADRGGPTRWGITQATLEGWRHRAVTAGDVAALGQDEARQIYRQLYWAGLEAVTDPHVAEFLFDFGVNSGPARSRIALQHVLGVTGDGIIGPATLGALAKVKDQATLLLPLVCERLDFYLRIVGDDYAHGTGSQAQFAIGWANRVRPFWAVPALDQAASAPTGRTV